jgi:hypothetical protein
MEARVRLVTRASFVLPLQRQAILTAFAFVCQRPEAFGACVCPGQAR